MQVSIKKGVSILAAAGLLLALGGVAWGATTAGEGEDNPVAARVNGRAIRLKQLTPNIDQALTRLRKYSTTSSSEQTRKKVQREELERQVDLELLVQEAEKSLSVEAVKKVDGRVQTQQASALSGGNPATAAGKSEEARQNLRRRLLADEYLAQRGLLALQVPEAEQRRFYEQNMGSFKEAEAVQVSHVLIALPKSPTPEELAKAREKIGMIREELKKGKDFGALAKEYSSCATAKEGGSLGYLTRGYMPTEFDRAAFGLKIGEVSEVVQTRQGFHLIKCFDRKPARIPEFAAVKGPIEKLLLKKFQARKVEEIVKDLRRDATIEITLN